MNLREEIFANQDLKYREFHKKLIPTVSEDKFVGVRVPVLRRIAKQALRENAENKCELYEEIMVYGFTIGLKKCSLEDHIEDLKTFVPLIDNWAVCDCCCSSFKFCKTYQAQLYDFIKSYLTKGEYEQRFAIVMLMDYYMEDAYIDEVVAILKNIKSDRYYVNMAAAWALSVAFVRYQDRVLPVLESKMLCREVQNMTIRKIKDSFRVERAVKKTLSDYVI